MIFIDVHIDVQWFFGIFNVLHSLFWSSSYGPFAPGAVLISPEDQQVHLGGHWKFRKEIPSLHPDFTFNKRWEETWKMLHVRTATRDSFVHQHGRVADATTGWCCSVEAWSQDLECHGIYHMEIDNIANMLKTRFSRWWYSHSPMSVSPGCLDAPNSQSTQSSPAPPSKSLACCHLSEVNTRVWWLGNALQRSFKA